MTSVALLPVRLVLISLLFPLGLGAQQLSGMHGSLCSPNFPEPYPRDTQLRWNVSVPDGFQIKLYFSHFDLEPSYLCEYDYVKVRTARTFLVCVCATVMSQTMVLRLQVEAEGEVLALFCGREQTDTEAVPAQQALTSPRNSLSLLFCSDFSDEERFSGFVAHYSAVGKNQPPPAERTGSVSRRDVSSGVWTVGCSSEFCSALV